MAQSYELQHLLDNNRKWVRQINAKYPQFFHTIAAKNKPQYMWIGCADSRVPANELLGLYPGEVFVHRNVGNVVLNSDLNALAAIQLAVDYLKVRHIMVVGHSDCSGVKAALNDSRIGLVDNWLRRIQIIRDQHAALLAAMAEPLREHALCALNVVEQLVALAKSTVVQDAWDKGQRLTLHGWVYRVNNGKMINLDITIKAKDQIESQRQAALARIRQICLVQPAS